jgi:hypothetical protein
LSLLGIHLTLLMGPGIAVPAPLSLAEALKSVSVTNNDTGRSGFSLTFEVGRTSPLDMLDYALLLNPLLRPFTRIVLVVTFGVLPQVLCDGVITNVQLQPSNEPGASTLTVTGEDVSVMMDLKELPFPWPAMSADAVVGLILLKYMQYGLTPVIFPAVFPNPPSPTERVPVQTHMTDLNYINFLAARQGYVFYIDPGFVPNTNFAYWGPPHIPPPYRAGPPQKAITFNCGPETNASSVSITNNALAPTLVAGFIQDSQLNRSVPVVTSPRGLRVPLAREPAIIFNQPNVRLSLLPATPEQARRATSGGGGTAEEFPDARTTAGVTFAEAMARAQATTDASTDNVVTVSGELDALEFGEILRARALVGLRGVGQTYGGNYYVKSVSHEISRGQYKQRFTLTREGTGVLVPLVVP